MSQIFFVCPPPVHKENTSTLLSPLILALVLHSCLKKRLRWCVWVTAIITSFMQATKLGCMENISCENVYSWCWCGNDIWTLVVWLQWLSYLSIGANKFLIPWQIRLSLMVNCSINVNVGHTVYLQQGFMELLVFLSGPVWAMVMFMELSHHFHFWFCGVQSMRHAPCMEVTHGFVCHDPFCLLRFPRRW